MNITKDIIFLESKKLNKQQVLKKIADLMNKLGLTQTNYYPYLTEREEISNTYLANGIAIPHGTLESKNQILKTGLIILHLTNPVNWGNGNLVYLAVGIVANNNEHLKVLHQISHFLKSDKILEKLQNIKNHNDILKIFHEKQNNNNNETIENNIKSKSLIIKIIGNEGLHLRLSKVLVKKIKQLNNQVWVRNVTKNSKFVKASSLIQVLNLVAEKGDELEFKVSETNYKTVLDDIKKIF